MTEKKTKSKPCQSRNWCFTDFELKDWKYIYGEYRDIIRYVCWGLEECPKTKKKHYQGWIQFVNKKRMNRVKKIAGSTKIHLESCFGTEAQNNKYCQKDNKYKTCGTYKRQGQRTDLESIYKKITMDGASKEDIMKDHFGVYCQYRNGIKDLFALTEKNNSKKFRVLEVELYHGATGTGKTRKAVEENQEAFLINGFDLEWFDGYNGEKTLIIDEYSNDIKITKLLKLLDGYQCRLPVKGSHTYANWEKVIITTNLKVEELHENAKEEHQKALMRRITKTLEF